METQGNHRPGERREAELKFSGHLCDLSYGRPHLGEDSPGASLYAGFRALLPQAGQLLHYRFWRPLERQGVLIPDAGSGDYPLRRGHAAEYLGLFRKFL